MKIIKSDCTSVVENGLQTFSFRPIKNAVSRCPAAGQRFLKNTACPAVRKFSFYILLPLQLLRTYRQQANRCAIQANLCAFQANRSVIQC